MANSNGDKNVKETVELSRPTKIRGGNAKGSTEVYAFQRRHLIDGGYANGTLEDVASEGEKAAGALEVLKDPEQRKDLDGGVWSVDRAYAENDEGQGAADQSPEDSGSASDSGSSSRKGK